MENLQRNMLEVCAASLHSVSEAAAGGAARVELCSALGEGGVTPSAGFITSACAIARKAGLKVHVLIRPRGGDFVYDAAETACMAEDVCVARRCGADGVVIGALLPDGSIDMDTCAALIDKAGDMSVTFHRAFDLCRTPHTALEAIIRLGCHRLLTSGCAPSAMKGVGTLDALNRLADGRIIIMPGAGVTPDNAASILRLSGCHEIHASARCRVDSAMTHRHAGVSMGTPGADEFSRMETSAGIVAAIVKEINR
ncbi:MAG: copper homeostasis protein CutC [Muribaculaceae bacterium]|nr:copper homeostasis protein CutC [Muribaculaceae bacterium]